MVPFLFEVCLVYEQVFFGKLFGFIRLILFRKHVSFSLFFFLLMENGFGCTYGKWIQIISLTQADCVLALI